MKNVLYRYHWRESTCTQNWTAREWMEENYVNPILLTTLLCFTSELLPGLWLTCTFRSMVNANPTFPARAVLPTLKSDKGGQPQCWFNCPSAPPSAAAHSFPPCPNRSSWDLKRTIQIISISTISISRPPVHKHKKVNISGFDLQKCGPSSPHLFQLELGPSALLKIRPSVFGTVQGNTHIFYKLGLV